MAGRRDVLILTGNAGVGKTTIARAWAAKRGGAAIAGDDIRHWIRVRELKFAEGDQEQSLARITSAAAREFLAKDLDVVADNVWTPHGIAMLRESLDPLARVRAARLWCAPGENHRRDELRAPGDVMGQRIDELEAELSEMHFGDDVVLIDSTDQSPEQTLAAIERLFTARAAY